jgi:hypothetical protein
MAKLNADLLDNLTSKAAKPRVNEYILRGSNFQTSRVSDYSNNKGYGEKWIKYKVPLNIIVCKRF